MPYPEPEPTQPPLWVVLLCCALAAVCIAPALMCGGLLITN